MAKNYRTVLFDFDSTLVTIEGVDELARTNNVYPQVANLTTQAMNGEIEFEDVFSQRLQLIKPTETDLQTLANTYAKNVMPGAREVISTLTQNGIDVGIVSGGYQQAIIPLAASFGIDPDHVWAIELSPDSQGYFTRVNSGPVQPTTAGKRNFIAAQPFTKKVAFVGDGSTDLLTQSVVDTFISFGGVCYRPHVHQGADYAISQPTLAPIIDILL